MSRITTNFRGLRALVLHPEGPTRDRLAAILERLGLGVSAQEIATLAQGAPPPCDLVLFDADEEIEAPLLDGLSRGLPTIALIGNEAPSRLARVVRFRCNSHILKPIRNTGVYSAVVLAINDHDRQRQTERDLAALRQRLAGRRVVMKAVLHRMETAGMDEDAAYEHLRRRAMELRVPIEEAARRSLDPQDLPLTQLRQQKA